MAEPLMPAEIINWISAHNWGQHHEQWHAVRQWDVQTAEVQNWMRSQGWRRAGVQEGAPGNGLEFLAMHRAMLELLREAFPAHTALFEGWATPPTNPRDPGDTLPNGAMTPFDPNMLTAIGNIGAPPASWLTDDDFGLYVETPARPAPGNRFRTSPDPTTGLHNYLHRRFSDRLSPVDMGVPRVNLANQRFWRLHGWIDAQWSAFRAARGFSDADPAYQAAMQAARTHASGMPGMSMELMGVMAQSAVATMPEVPTSIAHPFATTLSKDFAQLAERVPKVESINDLELLLQCALKVEHFTIPPYLCALWSLKGTSPSVQKIRRIFREVARQEMLHMGIVCNLLNGIGRKPKIVESVPNYPDFLPGVAMAQPVGLEKFSADQLSKFREIEKPAFTPVPIPELGLLGVSEPLRFNTIGELYSIISDGFTYLQDQGKLTSLQTAGQMEDDEFSVPGKLEIYATIPAALAAIDLIRGQGEGRPDSPAQPGPDQGQLAHYYLFGQIVDGKEYVLQSDGAFKQDPSRPITFPAAADVHDMAPVPANGYPTVSHDFDQAYSDTVRLLDDAWNGPGGAIALSNAHYMMLELASPAITLMETPRTPPYGPGNFGPSFLFLPAVAPAPIPNPGVPGPSVPPGVGGSSYARIQAILDDAVRGENIGAHGPFWPTLDRDGFVAKAVFGRPLLAKNPDGTFNATESNLVKALEGRAPFDGTLLDRMPIGYPQVPQIQIDEIRAWIAAGCPAGAAEPAGLQLMGVAAPAAGPPTVDLTAGGPQPGNVHNGYWRTLDEWSMNSVTQATGQDIMTFMDLARSSWLAYARDPAQLGQWTTAILQNDLPAIIGRLEQAQRNTVTTSYGSPVAFLSLLDGYEKFGRDDLPNDPLHGSDPRHRMDGRTQWFVWGAFADACLQLGGTIPSDFWHAMFRAILAGLINDGLFRNRFTVLGFTRDAAGAEAINVHVRSLQDSQLQDQLVQRFLESRLPGI